jgi:hypothetical protein
MKTRIVLALITSIILLAQCKKDEIFSGSATLTFSQDSILFDTVFTTVGSTTKILKVFNPYKQTVNIASVSIKNGDNSFFRMNVDGRAGYEITDVEILPEDSIYIFVEVTIDPKTDYAPGEAFNPFIKFDQIIFNTNGNEQTVDLIAWGQDAIFYTPNKFPNGLPPYAIIPDNTVWTFEKPIVIYGYAVVDSAASLTIEANTQVYFHNGAGLWIYKDGTLTVNGEVGAPVVFQGDRLEAVYDDEPGQWDRIWINEGATNSVIKNAVIKNAFIGIQAETLVLTEDDLNKPTSTNWLELENVIIENASGYGLYGRNYRIKATNTLISNCGLYSVGLTGGGQYNFNHVTIGNYWGFNGRQTPAMYISNTYELPRGTINVRNIDNSVFQNMIIYGNTDTEFDYDFNDAATIDVQFDYCLMKTTVDVSDNNYFSNLFTNSDPRFVAPSTLDFHLSSSSSAINVGNPSTVFTDLDGNSRDGQPDLGCYEFF